MNFFFFTFVSLVTYGPGSRSKHWGLLRGFGTIVEQKTQD